MKKLGCQLHNINYPKTIEEIANELDKLKKDNESLKMDLKKIKDYQIVQSELLKNIVISLKNLKNFIQRPPI